MTAGARPTTLRLGALSLALLAAFVVREATARNPLMPLRIFRSRNVSGANAIQALLVAGMFGMFFLGALYLQRVLGYNPLEIGLAFLPTTVIMGTLSLRYTERLIMRFGARTTLLPGLVLIMAGLLLFTRAPVDGDYVHARPAGDDPARRRRRASFPALMTLAMSGATAERRRPRLGPGQHDRRRSAARSASPCSRRSRPPERQPARRRRTPPRPR